MPYPRDDLTLESLTQIPRDHITGTATKFAQERAERRAQDAELRARIEDLRREIGTVATLFHDLAQVAARAPNEAATPMVVKLFWFPLSK